jgi:transposase
MAESQAKEPVAPLDEENARLRAENERLRAENEKLKALLEEARRSGKRQAAPFSNGEPKPDPKRSGRKPGAAYGRSGHRPPPKRIDEVYPAPLPSECPCCSGRHLVREATVPQYQTEIPRRPIHRRFDVETGYCADCGARVQGRHALQTSDALGAAASQLGPDAQALATMLNKDLGLSHGKVGRVLESFGITLSRGGSAQVMLRAAQRCGAAYKEIQVAVRKSAWVVPDETGWRVGGVLHWLHVFVTAQATLYLIRDSRGFDVGCEALGAEYAGHMTHDGWSPYDRFVYATHTQCNAHLLRRCKELLETARGAAVLFPRRVKELLQAGLALRDRRDAGALAGAALKGQITRLQNTLGELCAPLKTNPDNERLAKFLFHYSHEVFNYLRHPGTDATNWRAEQATRPAVVNRKVWGGSRTEVGAAAQGILMSVSGTAKQRGKSFVGFLSDTLRASPGETPLLLSG